MNFLIEFDYVAEEPDELSVQKGDVVNDVKFYEDGWMIGVLKGKKGVFPSNFGKEVKTEIIQREESQEDVYVMPIEMEALKEKQQPEEIKPPSVKKVMGVGFGDIFSGKQIQLKHTNLNEGKLHANEDDSKTETNIDKRHTVSSFIKVEFVKAIYTYKAENPDELQFDEGDIIAIVDKKYTDEGWWQGKLNGKIGVFPNNFVVPHNSEEVIVKPTRPVTVNKVPPPVPLTAKPNTYKTKTLPTRPPNLDPVKNFPKTNLKSVDMESEEISFEQPGTHKPLVGPTVERVRRQNIRLPKKINAINNNTSDSTVSCDTNKITSPREKSIERVLQEDNSSKTATLNRRRASPSKEKASDSVVIDSTVSKTAMTLRERFTEITPQSTTSPEDFNKHSNHRSKSQYFGSSVLKEDDRTAVGTKDDKEVMKKKIISLESRITELEEANLCLKNNIADLTKNHSDNFTQLTNKVNKLLKDFEEEKSRRVAADNEIEEIKIMIDNLE